MGKPEIWGHRGASGDYPENTLLSFRKAAEAGAHGIELDIQKTSDGRFAVIHDEELERTAGRKGKIGGLPFADLEGLDAGGGERIPELAQVLEALAGYPGFAIDVELKEETIEIGDFAAVDAVLKPYSDTFRFLITSFEHDLLAPFSAAGYETGLLLGERHVSGGLAGVRRSIRAIRPTHLNLPVRIFDYVPPFLLKPAFRSWRRRGLSLAFWTVNEPDEFEKVRPLAAAVITDYPARMLALSDNSSG